MRHYETVYIIHPNLADEAYGDVVTKFGTLVANGKGVVTKIDEWGKRDLAYDIRKCNKGYYVLMQFCGEPGITDEIHRQLNLDDNILKSQTIQLSENADPEALKAQAEAEQAEKAGEAADAEAGPEGEEQDGES